MKWDRKNDCRRSRLREIENAVKMGISHVNIGVSRVKVGTAIQKLKRQMCEW